MWTPEAICQRRSLVDLFRDSKLRLEPGTEQYCIRRTHRLVGLELWAIKQYRLLTR